MKALHSLFNFRVHSCCLFCLGLLLSTYTLSGQSVTVFDESGITLPGVEVYTTDLTTGLITNDDGVVSLSGLGASTPINFRYLGYEGVSTTLDDLSKLDYELVMVVSAQLVEEVVVLGRKTVSQSEIAFQVKTIDIEDIRSTNSQTSADALSQHGGVYVQKSQMGGGSPVIRGFEANRVLLVVDDIRLNNAIYRSGHLQNAITVDQAMLDRMEVIFGPNSLMYGSDALGGVVNFKTRNPKLANAKGQTDTESQFYLRYASANHEKSAHYDFNYGSNDWGSLTSVTVSDYDDLRAGNNRDERFPYFGKRLIIQGLSQDGSDIAVPNENPIIQIGTGYKQIDVLQKFLFVPTTEHRISANFQYSSSSDVPRYDNISEVRNGQLRWGEWNYGPQKRLMAAIDYRHLSETAFYNQLTVIGAYQKIDEDRISRRFNNQMRNRQEEDVSVYSLTLDASKILIDELKLNLDYGADIQHNDVSSNATDTDIVTGLESSVVSLSRYASDQNELTNVGAYIYIKGQSKNGMLNLNSGIRYTSSFYKIKYDQNDPVTWPSSFYEGVTGNNNAVTWSIGSTYKINSSLQLRGMISTAFRSPNIDDLSKIRVNGDEITFPNINLKPERSTNGELTVAYQNEKAFNLSITGFYTRLDDAIIRKSFTAPDGRSTWVTQGDTLLIVGNQNAQNGIIKGLSINASGQIIKNEQSSISWEASANFTKGQELLDQGERLPLAHIPPAYGKIGFRYEAASWSLKGVYRYNGSKAIEDFGGSADNPDLATPIGSLSWSTINLYGNYKINDGLSISLALENLLDKHYRPFASGVSAPGINAIFSVKGSF